MVLFSGNASASPYVLDASTFPGSTAGQKIANALNALNQAPISIKSTWPNGGVSGGIIDARSLTGNQIIDVPLTLGIAWETSVTLLLGQGTYVVQSPITLHIQSSIIGTTDANGNPTTTLIAGPNPATPLWSVVSMGDGQGNYDGGASVLRNVIIDGNKANGGTVSNVNAAGVLISNSGSVNLTNVTVQNSAGQGVLLRFVGANPGSSGVGQVNFRKLTCQNNAFSGFKSQNTADNFIYQSAFNNNGLNGIELDTTPTVRMMNSVMDNNGQNGLYAYAAPTCLWCGLLVIINNTFENNCASGINIQGSNAGSLTNQANLIANNTLGGGACSPNQPAINITASQGNSIVDNTFTNSTTQIPWASAVSLTSSLNSNLIASNTLSGFSGNAYNVTPFDQVYNDSYSAFINAPLIPDTPAPVQPPSSEVSSTNGVDASLQAGSTAGQKIANALNALYAKLTASGQTSGFIDARGLNGNQLIDVPLQVGKPGIAVNLFLGGGVYSVNNTITVLNNSSIIGLPTGNITNTNYNTPSTVLTAIQNAGAGLWALVLMSGNGSSLHDLVLDGNAVNGGTVSNPFSAVVLVNNANQVNIADTTVRNSAGMGIIVRNLNQVGGGGVWANDIINRVMSINNAYSGLNIQNVDGVVVTQSQFEINGHDGIEANTSPGLTVILSDLGGNSNAGIENYSDPQCTSCGNMVAIGNQFGNNLAAGVNIKGSTNGVITSPSNRIAGDEFLATNQLPDTQAIYLMGDEQTQITGNMMSSYGTPSNYTDWISDIGSYNSAGSGNWFSGNVMDGPVSVIPIYTSGNDTAVENVKD